MAAETDAAGIQVTARTTTAAPSGHWAHAWRSLRRDRAALLGGAVIVGLIVVATFAPLLAPYDYAAQNMANRYTPPGGPNLLGTDHLGRDVLSRVL